ncbi:MAG: LacI family transcriptional regulator [Armatimonadetes bacterium]|nr:LacI family transcriptional regulator [Armatimonadota bacterium]
MAQIAQHLQLGRSTVAHVLNGRAAELKIRPETERRVLEAARELGYRPNSSARAMSTGRFGSVGLIQPSNAIHLPTGMLMGMTRELSKHNLHLSVSEAPDDALSDTGFLPKIVREVSADGLLINMIGPIPAPFLETLRSLETPAIWINSKQPTDCVYPDDFSASRLLTEYLIGLGHRRITYLQTGPAPAAFRHYSEADRRAGYEAVMHEAGLEPASFAFEHEPILPGGAPPDGRLDWARGVLEAHQPTAVIAYGLNTALPTYHAALQRGLRVPHDLSLALFHSDIERISGVGFTTMCHLDWSLGEAAVAMLMDRMRDPETELPAHALPAWLYEGRTCAPPAHR